MNQDMKWRGFSSYTKQVRVEDLACPTWGLMNPEDKKGYVTVGSPFFPIIHPPSEITAIDPAWSRCTEFATLERMSNYLPYEVFDPPRMLVPASAIAPATNPIAVVSSADPKPTVGSPPGPNPVDTRSPDLPSSTGKPSSSDLVQSSTNKPERTFAENSKPAPTGNSENLDPKESNHRFSKMDPNEAIPDAVESTLASEPVRRHSHEAIPGMEPTEFSTLGGPGIHNPSSIRDSEPSRLDPGGERHFTFAGKVFSTHLSNMFATIGPDGSGVTRSSTRISLDSDGSLTVDPGTVQPTSFPPTSIPPSAYTINGLTLSGNLSFLSIDGKPITPGGPGITVSGTRLQPEPSGTLRLGTTQIALPTTEIFRGGQGRLLQTAPIVWLGLVIGAGGFLVGI